MLKVGARDVRRYVYVVAYLVVEVLDLIVA